jgi:SAM-dependent methyltransferase
MAYDHSINYRRRTLKTLPHRLRLQTILAILAREGGGCRSYADVGCSNGYITALVRNLLKPTVCAGFDHAAANLEQAGKNYPDIEFAFYDLNVETRQVPQYDVVTCFETLEHVGHLPAALANLLHLTRRGGLLFIVAPVEIGFQGLLRFLAKTVLWRYKLDELSQDPQIYLKYLGTLLSSRRISAFRDQRAGWGTHFGFDYRDVDDCLQRLGAKYTAFNKWGSRYYLVKK